MAKKDEVFYWLKLKRDFFKRHDIKIIEDMPNGKDYVLFYLKLLCESIDHQGSLRFSDTIPYNEQMLSTITDTNIDIVRSAMKLFIELKLIDVLDTGTIYMSEIESLLATDTYWAQQKRLQRSSSPMVNGNTTASSEVMSNDVQQMSNESYSYSNSNSKSIYNKDSNNKECTNNSNMVESIYIDNTKSCNIDKSKTKSMVTVKVSDLVESVRKLYKDCEYSKKFMLTNTSKRIKSIIKNKTKSKMLYPLQIYYAYSAYLGEKHESDTEIEFIKQSDTFLTTMVYDYADKTTDKFENVMSKKYGEDWRKKINFIYED